MGVKKLLPEDEVLVFCPETKHFYNRGSFPRSCNTCQKIFNDRAEYLKETLTMAKGSYSKGIRGKVFEYRNCLCGSTLVCAVESNRDNSPEGLKRRKEFDRKVKFLASNGVDIKRARTIVLIRFRQKQAEEAKELEEKSSKKAS